MYSDLMQFVFSGCTDIADKFFCLMMFCFTVEIFVGLISALIGGVRKR